MEYARLGRSNMRVSKLALGTMNFGPRTLEQFEASVRAAQIGLPPDVLARLDEIFPPLYDRASSVAPRR